MGTDLSAIDYDCLMTFLDLVGEICLVSVLSLGCDLSFLMEGMRGVS